jgi:large subunit ribosomal protein L10
MKTISLEVKEITEAQIKNRFKESGAVLIVKYSGLSSPDLCALRQNLNGQNVKLFVVKNSVARRALKSFGLDDLCAKITGPSGFVFVKDEPVSASRILCDFAKTHEPLKLEGGFLKGRILETKDIQALAKLPSKDILRAQVVMALKSPISGFVIVLNQTLKKFVCCVDQIKQKKASS